MCEIHSAQMSTGPAAVFPGQSSGRQDFPVPATCLHVDCRYPVPETGAGPLQRRLHNGGFSVRKCKEDIHTVITVALSVRKEITKILLSTPSVITQSMLKKNKDSEASNPTMTPCNKNQIRNLKRRQWLIDAGHKAKKVINFKINPSFYLILVLLINM